MAAWLLKAQSYLRRYRGDLTRNLRAGTAVAAPQKTLTELGISYDQSSKQQQLANVPDEQFEARLAGTRNPHGQRCRRSAVAPSTIGGSSSGSAPATTSTRAAPCAA
jgi:hypothetical protein